ncbi:hypothetical protein Vafri_4997 [Volvox africanus]|uniref:SWIM-type domain-containing protein n=1 Tax=Volvox africanus TaxID=51714 RepID=A0A8J4AVF5_9CHLO|nr:hypothetical protein Vafri_4997 [Volvox africanus]
MFLLDSRQLSPIGSPGGPSQEFHVLGATGNVYTVRINRNPHCSCPDFGKGHLCKHILFVMLRVLRQSPENPVIWQRALLTHEVGEVLGPLAATGNGAGTVDQSVLATERVRQRYAAITSGATVQGSTSGAGGVQRPVEGECPICYENLVASGGGPAEAITFCTSCGNNMHKDCFDRWATSKRSSGQTVTCVYCRAPWKTAAGVLGDNGSWGWNWISAALFGFRDAWAATSCMAEWLAVLACSWSGGADFTLSAYRLHIMSIACVLDLSCIFCSLVASLKPVAFRASPMRLLAAARSSR